jgi:Na+/H+ antiporter NhaD/arsenite permease-like protein
MIILSTFITPPIAMVIPFVLLLLLIATGPLLFAQFWHHYYKAISVVLGLLVSAVYIFYYHDSVLVLETLAEYVSFISLLLALFIASGGIYIFADFESKATVNITFLLIGALLTNVIGTTGASVLLIRPFMRINRYRLKPYHIVFFIFFVSNLGGLLTPIGDPPLFMGFLRGVPFFWTTEHLFLKWTVAMFLLSGIFYFFEKRNTQLDDVDISAHYTGKIKIEGKRNFIALTLIIAAVFIDPNTIQSIPYIEMHGKKVSYIREILLLSIAAVCYFTANKKAMQSNQFDFEPIKEVAYLFIGIFLTMIPALQLLSSLGSSGIQLSPATIYWSSGFFSSVLDNAPTYVNFFTFSLTMLGYNAHNLQSIHAFLQSSDAVYLIAISVGSVFFGALTYIGNGPNFMVKAIAEQAGVKMPSFFEYILKYSLPILLPILIIIWLVFFI